MSKSVCIKTNNASAIKYLIGELETLDLDNVYFSCRQFKEYTNIIIHYKNENTCLFLSSLSKILTYLILDLYEYSIITNLVKREYFYFSKIEQEAIINICIKSLNSENYVPRFHILESAFYNYLDNTKTLNLLGFINFRINNYIKHLDSIVDVSVNKFIIDKEYLEFINVLKSYVTSSKKTTSTIHLIYKNGSPVLLDSNKKIITSNTDIFRAHFLSDISFSNNDYILNSLLTFLPQELYIHLIDKEDEFINTLKLIFDSCVHICTDCNICRLYKSTCTQHENY